MKSETSSGSDPRKCRECPAGFDGSSKLSRRSLASDQFHRLLFLKVGVSGLSFDGAGDSLKGEDAAENTRGCGEPKCFPFSL
ncbi:MAG TPA: hypothetical protein VN873_12695 [Candidatus Angelobacter sp.]|nr:hypothetical protein [Candidatus Angelobacter sp.]